MELTPLDDRARLLFHLQALSRLVFFWLPVAAMGGTLLAVFVDGWLGIAVGVGIALLAFLFAVWYPMFAFERWGYHVDDDEVLIARGVFLRKVTAIPVDRIQHVDTRQGILEQWFGLARVQIYTASQIGADGIIPGLQLGRAEGVRDRLVRLGGGDDGV